MKNIYCAKKSDVSVEDFMEICERIENRTLSKGVVIWISTEYDPEFYYFVSYKNTKYYWIISVNLRIIAGESHDILAIVNGNRDLYDFISYSNHAEYQEHGLLKKKVKESKQCYNHELCFWCDYFKNFELFIFSEEMSAEKLICCFASYISHSLSYDIPLVITLAKYHYNEVSCETIKKLDELVPDIIKRLYRRIMIKSFIGQDELEIEIDNPFSSEEEARLMFDRDIGKIKPQKSARN